MKTNRRNFIKTSGAAVTGGMILPPYLQSFQNVQMSKNVKYYLDHFEVSTEMLQQVIAAAMSKGGDYADLFFEHKKSNSLALEDNKVNRAISNVGFGVGIRVLKGDQTGFAYSETVTPEAMLNAAKVAANIASQRNDYTPAEITEKIPANYYRIINKWEDVSVENKIPYVQKINDRIFSLDEKVIKVNAFLTDETSYVLFYNSEGRLTYDYRPLVNFGASCIMQKEEKIENSYAARSFRTGFEWLSDGLVNELAQEAVDRTNLLFEATKPKAGEMPVVMGAGGSGILLHEAIGHTFEADFNRKGTSIFSDKMGKKVAESFVNIIDDGTLENNRGSINVDDEGNDVQKTYLVKDGVLNSYIHDRISARFYGVEPTGNGRRDVDNFSNGEVKIGAGDFTFFVKSGYLIEKGKLTQPIKDINIIGNGPQALADITMAGGDYLIDNSSWSCGKGGQTVPVTCGLPTVLVKKLTVGGSV